MTNMTTTGEAMRGKSKPVWSDEHVTVEKDAPGAFRVMYKSALVHMERGVDAKKKAIAFAKKHSPSNQK